MANSWNESGTTWGTNRWGTTNEISSGWGADAIRSLITENAGGNSIISEAVSILYYTHFRNIISR